VSNTLSEQQKNKAKEKAMIFLEQSIFQLSIQLGVDEDDLTNSYEIPVQETDLSYNSFLSLLRMKQNLDKLKS
jgi:hypothetical protein